MLASRALAAQPRGHWALLGACLLSGACPEASLTAQDDAASALDKALGDALAESAAPATTAGSPAAAAPAAAGPSTSSDLASRPVGSATLRLIDLSLDGLFAAGTSTEPDGSLESLQGGGHDPRKRGFTVQNVELSLVGAVDPFLSAEAHIVYFIDPITGDSKVELEEAYATTQQLPAGLQLEAGQFFTEFGRLNAQHPHQWSWLDQPVVSTRFFGPDGMRGPGARLGWLTPLPWFSEVHVGVQNSNGETMTSFLSSDTAFEERPIGGRPFVKRDVRTLKDLVYLLRWDHGFDISDSTSAKLGVSGLYGPNSTGPHGYTRIYGADLVVKWRPPDNDSGWPFVVFESEVMRREYHADSAVDPGVDPLDPADDVLFDSGDFGDFGLYTQLLWGFLRNWAVGARYEYASGGGPPGDGRREDPFRDDRHRVSPVLAWHPTHFSRLRLQYNYDHATHLTSDEAHSVWLGLEFLFGSHPAHSY